MKRGLVKILLVAAAVVCGGTLWTVGETGPKTQTRLPGARPAIEAAEYPTLQAAIDALPAEGGVVRLPAGTFEITQPLVISRPDVLLQGAGTGTHIINRNVTGQAALILEHPDGRAATNKKRLWRIMLSNFRITGNPHSGHGIEVFRIQEVFIQGVTVSEHGGDGIRLDDCYEDPRISDCLISYNKGAGLNLIRCHDIVVSANHFEENRDAVRCVDGFNLCMTGNNLDDHLRDGVVIENTYGSIVSANMIEECVDRAVVLDRDCYGITISANVIAHNGRGIDLVDAHGCSVAANTFTLMKNDALRIGPNSGRITVTGNNFSDSYVGAGKIWRRKNDRTAAGMTLNATTDVAVSGNLFSGVRPKAVDVRGKPSRRILFTGNVLTDVKSDQGRLQDSIIDDNILPANKPSKR